MRQPFLWSHPPLHEPPRIGYPSGGETWWRRHAQTSQAEKGQLRALQTTQARHRAAVEAA